MTTQPAPSDPEFGAPEGTTGPSPSDYLRFAAAAVRRRALLLVAIVVACFSVLGLYYTVRAPLYRAETTVLAQRLRAVPSVARSSGDDPPTKAAWELIHDRSNLVELVKTAGLADGAVKRSPTDEEPVDVLVRLLDRRLKVDASDVTIAIEVDWPDPQQAYRIVEGALQNFLEARHVQEVTALDEVIAGLRGRAAKLRDELALAVEETRAAAQRDAASARPPAPSVAASPRPRGDTEELVRLRSMLEAKERAIADVEEFRRRRLAELQVAYDSRRAVYAEGHPEMRSLRLDIEALSHDSPQITALRAEEQRLRKEYEARAARGPAPRATAGPAGSARPATDAVNAAVEQSDRVREARQSYEDITASVNKAQLELDAARSAFKYRYKVIWPTQMPRKPVSPNPLKIFGAGGLASVVLALLAAVALDWRSGRLLQRWQIERGLNLPILAQLRRRG